MHGNEAARASRWRRIGVVLVLVIVLVLALFMRYPSATATAKTSGMTVAITYPRLIVPGTPTPLVIRAEFDTVQESVDVHLCTDLVDHLDFQNWYPNPDTETASAHGVTYTFQSDGKAFAVRIDARAQPNQWPRPVHCPLVISTSDARVELDLRSFVIA